jgi:hypothetical protein
MEAMVNLLGNQAPLVNQPANISSYHDDYLLTTKQAAEYFNMSTAWFEKMRMDKYAAKGPPFLRIGRRCIRYHLRDTRRWFSRR